MVIRTRIFYSLVVIVFFCWNCPQWVEGAGLPKILPARGFNVILQPDKLSKSPDGAIEVLSKLDQNILITDYSFDGSKAQKWSSQQIRKLKFSHGRPKIVLAYISIGEAETYRSYWRKKWNIKKTRPNFILEENPNWEGNFKVKYWNPTWQSIVMEIVHEIIEQGFDGVFLDIVDGFEYFEFEAKTGEYIDGKINSETKKSYRKDMVAWVNKISELSRFRKPGFYILPQNGTQLLESSIYSKSISGIVIEDLWTDGKKKQPKDSINYKSSFLRKAKRSKLPVFVIEYCRESKLKDSVIQWARGLSASLLIADRDLSTTGQSYPSQN